MTKPYTYVIICKSTGQQYYGVRYAKNCNPDDLWVSYFTSSKHVKCLIKKYGLLDFEVKIRKTFISAEEAIAWEHRFLTKIDVLNNPLWINYSVGGILRANKNQIRAKNSFKKGYNRSSSEIAKRNANYEKTSWVTKEKSDKLVRLSDVPYYMSIGYVAGRSFVSDGFRALCRQRIGNKNPAFGRKRPDLGERNKGRCWINDGIVNKRVPLEERQTYLEKGFSRGRIVEYSEDTIQRMSESASNRPRKIDDMQVDHLLEKGWSFRKVAREFNVSPSSVRRWARERR